MKKINPHKVSLEKKGRTQGNRWIKLEDILRSRRYRRNRGFESSTEDCVITFLQYTETRYVLV